MNIDDGFDDVDPYCHRSAMMLRDLHRIKEAFAESKMRDAFLADLKEYDRLLSRIQLELSTLEPAKLKVANYTEPVRAIRTSVTHTGSVAGTVTNVFGVVQNG